jgi:hypothetical protein
VEQGKNLAQIEVFSFAVLQREGQSEEISENSRPGVCQCCLFVENLLQAQ